MSFYTETTLAGYARAAVHLKTGMVGYSRTDLARQYVTTYLDTVFATTGATPTPKVVTAVDRIAHQPWQLGDPYVLAPEMSAIVAAAAQALDLTGEVVPVDIAPSDDGVLFLPEPIYHRGPSGRITSVGAITWTRVHNSDTGSSDWWITGWTDRDDPIDPSAVLLRASDAQTTPLATSLGPYILNCYARLPTGRPVPTRPDPVAADNDIEWMPAPDGRYCIDESTIRVKAVAAIAYAFWVIQAQPLTTVAAPPLDRAARRRAVRHRVAHQTRVVMLRRRKPVTGPHGGEAKWHYRVRFFVKGHWRHLVNADGQPYRIWIHQHIKGPDDAPLLLGDVVNVLAR
ncbi:hypothetical protein [Micromonospora yangpuensis]|uniref:Uncharacterized protein n=1 Tax=Micromonospora yangpuensis TaxID=683228 RepID=A0A1C6U4E6_9ACTN|nr:hypothetical protein [Micromonospora yangpuensis]GGL92995.1 hypothetical protein GCM10012279_08380 [Micromonospora yangpuensis]SCL48793.1 hypothetical protein GA0070617_0980 [Micromonospora yangpuensis]